MNTHTTHDHTYSCKKCWETDKLLREACKVIISKAEFVVKFSDFLLKPEIKKLLNKGSDLYRCDSCQKDFNLNDGGSDGIDNTICGKCLSESGNE